MESCNYEYASIYFIVLIVEFKYIFGCYQLLFVWKGLIITNFDGFALIIIKGYVNMRRVKFS